MTQGLDAAACTTAAEVPSQLCNREDLVAMQPGSSSKTLNKDGRT